MKEVIDHVLQLVCQPKACPSHVDAVYARKCVLFILRTVIGGTLGEKAQIAAAKEICMIVVKHMNAIDVSNENSQSSSETSLQHHVIVCSLHELSCLVQSLGTSAAPLVSEPASGKIQVSVCLFCKTNLFMLRCSGASYQCSYTSIICCGTVCGSLVFE